MTINIITLGCSKNSVDSEVIASKFTGLGHQIFFESERDTDIVLINTCSFIRDAKEESIEEIFLQIDRKNKGLVKKVYVMGCLAQRYKSDLADTIPEVDGFYTFTELPALLQSEDFDLLHHDGRELSTPSHYAYLKISEGCDRQCSFCAIPGIRGRQISKPLDLIIRETHALVEKGVKELILIAQDLTYYGMDLSRQRELDRLLEALAQIRGLEWIRLHYAYPNDFPYRVLEVMAKHPNICKYLDIPLQHINENVLKSMNRPSTPAKIYQLIDTIRARVPGITLRTTLISGYPTETKEAHKELVKFIEDVRFERLGVFSYSPEEGTPAFPLGDPVKPKEKNKRLEELMTIQEGISHELNHARVGSTMKVIIDDQENDLYIGRTEFDSPEVDNSVFISSPEILTIGNFYPVHIDRGDPYDLYGTLDKA